MRLSFFLSYSARSCNAFFVIVSLPYAMLKRQSAMKRSHVSVTKRSEDQWNLYTHCSSAFGVEIKITRQASTSYTHAHHHHHHKSNTSETQGRQHRRLRPGPGRPGRPGPTTTARDDSGPRRRPTRLAARDAPRRGAGRGRGRGMGGASLDGGRIVTKFASRLFARAHF
ncbi:hypothetical protein JOL62DRAFT_563036, partial [Phyllosticta paracitricarpa]